MDRGRKRPEADTLLPAVDKRPCSSTRSSSSDAQAAASSSLPDPLPPPPPDHRSGGGGGGGGGVHVYSVSKRADAESQSKFERILPVIIQDDGGIGVDGDGRVMAALVELCEVLSLSMEDSLSSFPIATAVPALVRLSCAEGSPYIMLLAARALTYLCDAVPRAADVIVNHGALPFLCSKLMAIEYLDMAEQCLQALEKISRRQPVPCLHAGAIMASLSYIDFFATSVQRVALSIVSNICKRLPSENASLVMDAVPVLCNFLLYDDPKLVETAASCLIRITECVIQSPKLLDELCNHGLINQVLQLIAMDGSLKLGRSTYRGLFELLTKLAASSLVAVRMFFEFNIGGTLKTVLLASLDLSHGASHHLSEVSQPNQVHEILKLVLQMIPSVSTDAPDIDLVLAKEKILTEQPDLLLNFSRDMLPVIVQVADHGSNLLACYGCVSVMNNIFYLCTPEILLGLISDMNISCFIAGLLSRKNNHIQMLALKVIDILMRKLHDVFLGTFMKEGVIHAIESLLVPEKCSVSIAHMPSCMQDSEYRSCTRDIPKCLCYAFYSSKTPSPEAQSCRLENGAVLNLARHLKCAYFSNSMDDNISSTEIFEKLKTYCVVLDENVDKFTNNPPFPDECYLTSILSRIMQELGGEEVLSTFELVESGLVRSLVHYLSNGRCTRGRTATDSTSYLFIQKRCQTFSAISLPKMGEGSKDMLMTSLVSKFQNALSTFDSFPVLRSHDFKPRYFNSNIPAKQSTFCPCVRIHFVKEKCESQLLDYDEILTVEISSSIDAVEEFLWSKVGVSNHDVHDKNPGDINSTNVALERNNGEVYISRDSDTFEGLANQGKEHLAGASGTEPRSIVPGADHSPLVGVNATSSTVNDVVTQQKLIFSLAGKDIDRSLSLYQALLQGRMDADSDLVIGPIFWNEVHEVKFRRSGQQNICRSHMTFGNEDEIDYFWQKLPFISDLLTELPYRHDSAKCCSQLLLMLKVLESLNRFSFHILSQERIEAFAEGKVLSFDDLRVSVSHIPQIEFVNRKLTDKLQQQIRDPLVAMSGGSMPSWCSQLMATCPFLFSFEARWKYFLLVTNSDAIRLDQVHHLMNYGGRLSGNDRHPPLAPIQRNKFKVSRDHILKSASKMMDSHARNKLPMEVEYNGEVGTGLGPTMEFYTLVSREFQKAGLGMWRCDQSSQVRSVSGKYASTTGYVAAPCGLFPRPWRAAEIPRSRTKFFNVLKNFKLLGQIVAMSIKDGRILDIPFSRAFYKLVLEQDLSIYDIQSFDRELGWTLLEFQALVSRKKRLESTAGNCLDLSYRNARIEDLCLDFSLPGYSNFMLLESKKLTVNIDNLEEYISLVVDATVRSGIYRQIEAFKSGFNEVLPLKALQVFTEDELEQLLCGEQDSWEFGELRDHVKFDHGYSADSPPVIDLLEIIQEFSEDLRQAFLQFVTGAPRLPLGGLGAFDPKMTIVRKHCEDDTDMGLPSVMTCVNYLKLPPYPSKDLMREMLLYAITEGQGSFHLS